ncbi:MAG: hypothetical protein ACUVWJ_03885 [Spirochaetota bacterium]
MVEQKERLIGIFIAVFCLTFSMFYGAYGFIARTGGSFIVEKGEVVNEDIYFAGEIVSIRGTVNGDLFMTAKTVNIEGNVKGGAFLVANRVNLSGSLSYSLRAFVNELMVEGKVGGDIFVVGNDAVISEKAHVKGDMVFGVRKLFLEGPVGGYILGGGRDVELRNKIGDDAYLAVKNLNIYRGAKIGGNLVYYSDKKAVIDPGAEIAGSITQRVPDFKERLKKVFPFVILAGVVGKILGYFMALLFGLAVILLMPRWMDSITITLKERFGACTGWGAVVLFAVPVGVAIACSTVVGITIGGVAFMLYFVGICLSQIVIGLFLGRLILKRFDGVLTAGAMFSAFALGLLIIRLLRFIPGIGVFVWLVVALFGLGAIVVDAGARRRRV